MRSTKKKLIYVLENDEAIIFSFFQNEATKPLLKMHSENLSTKVCYLCLILTIVFNLELAQSLKKKPSFDYYYENEQLLLNKIFTGYNLHLRPNDTVQIKLALNLIQIINIHEKDQIIVLNAFVDHKWTDPRLSWSITYSFFAY